MAVVKNLMVRAGADFSELEKKMKQAQMNLQTMGKKFNNVGSSMTKGITMPIVVAGVSLGALALKAGDAADELLTLSAQTGISTDSLQALDYASRFVDVELDALQKGWAKVTKAMGKAVDSGDKYIDIADGITVSIYGANGKLKTSEQMMYDTIDAIGKLKDETMKEIVAQDLFGKSYQDLMPLIKGGSKALKEYMDEAKKMGLVISEEDLKKMGEFDDATERLQAQLQILGKRIGVALLPAMEKLIPFINDRVVPAFQSIAEKVGEVIEWFVDLPGPVQGLIGAITGIAVVAGPFLMVLGSIATGLSGIIGLIGVGTAGGLVGSFLAIAGPVVAAGAVVYGLYKAFKYLWNSSPKFQAWAKGVGSAISDFFTSKINTAIDMVNALIRVLNAVTDWDVPEIKYKGKAKATQTTSNEDMHRKAASGLKQPAYYSTLKGFASGTNFAPGGLSIVGERGPELVNLPRGSQVLSNSKSMAAMGNQTVHHTGTVRVEGVTNRGELVAVVEKVFNQSFAQGNRRIPQRVAMLPSRA